MDTTMLSLFDHLGKAAGAELGKEVYDAAVKKKIHTKLETREVSNRKYTGKIMLYPKWFLDEYFGKNEHNENYDDLPF